jgi:RNA polymerase sigma-70 factor (ECF subfamily)
MSGTLHDAEDLLQDTLLKAWTALPGFEGRASLRTWLYRVATSVCLDAADRLARRTLPPEVREGEQASWLEPWPGEPPDAAPGPEARYGARQSVALAFLTALQRLPPRQRAVLLLRDVLGWEAAACAELMSQSVPAVNSALQRARETLARDQPPRRAPTDDDALRALLQRYLQAWEAADVKGLVAILSEDAVLSMPPLPAWYRGAQAIGDALAAMVLPRSAAGAFRLVAAQASGAHAFAMYEKDVASGRFLARSVHVLEVDGGQVAAITAFLEPGPFERFGLPPALP